MQDFSSASRLVIVSCRAWLSGVQAQLGNRRVTGQLGTKVLIHRYIARAELSLLCVSEMSRQDRQSRRVKRIYLLKQDHKMKSLFTLVFLTTGTSMCRRGIHRVIGTRDRPRNSWITSDVYFETRTDEKVRLRPREKSIGSGQVLGHVGCTAL